MPRPRLHAPFPVGDAPSRFQVADWVEFTTLASNAEFKRGDLKSALSTTGIKAADRLEQDTWDELEDRARLFGSKWPLTLAGQRLKRKSSTSVSLPLYRFLCCLALGMLEASDRKLFEILVNDLITTMVGHPALHIGAPASAGMNRSFRKRVETYTAKSGMAPAEIISPPLSSDQDGGIDVVAWQPFGDLRSGYLHFLAQCATGADWREKAFDINIPTWNDHLKWSVLPVRVFAVPFTLSMPPAKWHRLATEAGLVLDRPRLIELSVRRSMSAALIAEMQARVTVLAAV